MGTIIEATATATAEPTAGRAEARRRRGPLVPGAREPDADEVDLLINAGVYEDKSISEPAIASLIQEDIGANPEQQNGVGQGTFSFDVRNGACGLLTGIHLVDGMLASGTVELGMVVASDMDPEPGVSEGFVFPAVGGAILLSADDSRPGFSSFEFETFPEFADLFQSYMDWQEDARGREIDHGRNVLTVEIAESYADPGDRVRRIDRPGTVGGQRARPQPARPARRHGVGPRLRRRTGEATRRLRRPGSVALGRPRRRAHRRSGRGARVRATRRGRTALFVSAGAGITVVAALYRA